MGFGTKFVMWRWRNVLGPYTKPVVNAGRPEAVQMDPQQRLLIEHCYEALSVSSTGDGLFRGGTTSVFVGVASAEYLALSGHLGVTIFAATGMTRPLFLAFPLPPFVLSLTVD